jgi:hypothetical protein
MEVCWKQVMGYTSAGIAKVIDLEGNQPYRNVDDEEMRMPHGFTTTYCRRRADVIEGPNTFRLKCLEEHQHDGLFSRNSRQSRFSRDSSD